MGSGQSPCVGRFDSSDAADSRIPEHMQNNFIYGAEEVKAQVDRSDEALDLVVDGRAVA